MKKIVLTGGGTAGHVSPNLALIPRLLQEGYEIDYIGTEKGIEREMIARDNFLRVLRQILDRKGNSQNRI